MPSDEGECQCDVEGDGARSLPCISMSSLESSMLIKLWMEGRVREL